VHGCTACLQARQLRLAMQVPKGVRLAMQLRKIRLATQVPKGYLPSSPHKSNPTSSSHTHQPLAINADARPRTFVLLW
jgi:hypothetical protein